MKSFLISVGCVCIYKRYNVGYSFVVSLKHTATDIDIQKWTLLIQEKLHHTDVHCLAIAANELTFRIPFETNKYISDFFDFLDSNKKNLSTKTYGISATTLGTFNA